MAILDVKASIIKPKDHIFDNLKKKKSKKINLRHLFCYRKNNSD